MRFTLGFFPTLRDAPSDAEIASHKLMVRAGLIRRVSSGIYTLLPLGVKVHKKVEEICRRELNKSNAQEVLMPTLSPSELWKKTGRWDVYGKELIRVKDRHDRDFCLGPTHEEVITNLVANEVRSYRDLPLNLYQIQTKFRDEIRPRFGLMRGREFVMKDGYSFDVNDENASKSYEDMVSAYERIFQGCGLNFSAVEADSGAIGGSFSHEFVVLANSGEEEISRCDSCGYTSNVEKTPVSLNFNDKESNGVVDKVHTPDAHTVDDIVNLLKVSKSSVLKTLIYKGQKNNYAIIVPGNRRLNEVKLANVTNETGLALASATLVEELTNAKVGFAGPVGLKDVSIVADNSIKGRKNLIVGANETDYHHINVQENKDFHCDAFEDLLYVEDGDTCPSCNSNLSLQRGIEVGHVFKLGTKYSDSFDANYLDENGKTKPIIMGCYGIGIGRTVAAAIEQNHDENGIIWPLPLAPYVIDIIPMNMDDSNCVETSEKIYEELKNELQIDCVLDDRNERPGVKFFDSDLIGFPFNIIIGKKGLLEKKVEIKSRKTGEVQFVELEKLAKYIKDLISAKTTL
ncbi:MAG: proline--tRNA ligase [Nitrospinota bacterium]|nr:proline--tRNA ligase [Nitrospinota bacterium]